MTISINWITRVISVPKSYLTYVSGSTYQLDLDSFRLDLKTLESDPFQGIAFPDTHRHNTEVTVSGITLARVVEIINDYTITFEDGAYITNVIGGNNNIGEVANFNQVRVNSNNSAGLQVVETRAALTDAQDLTLSLILKYHANRTLIDPIKKTLSVYDDDQVTPIKVFDLSNRDGNASIEEIFERVPE